MSLDARDDTMQEAVVYTPLGNEREYRVAYETDANGSDHPFIVRLEFPNHLARYRVKVTVEQIPQEASPP